MGALLLVTGAAMTIAAAAWTQEFSYSVWIDADSALSWTLTLPRPIGPMPVEASGSVSQRVTVETPKGTMDNVSGHGSATLRYHVSRSFFQVEPYSDLVAATIDLGGRDGWTGVWIARESANDSSSLTVFASSYVQFHRIDESLSCGSVGFTGALQEGWNLLALQIGDCSHTLPSVPLAYASLAVGAAGASVVFLAWWRGRRGANRE